MGFTDAERLAAIRLAARTTYEAENATAVRSLFGRGRLSVLEQLIYLLEYPPALDELVAQARRVSITPEQISRLYLED